MANEYFKEIYAQYLGAYFILNYREVDDWITVDTITMKLVSWIFQNMEEII